MAGKIFINYRRDDSISTAGRLHDRLAQTFGRKNLFMDVDQIPAGFDFVEYLHSQVAACDVFLAVIGPNWLNAKDDDGRRRFDNPDDYVTVEIAAALARSIPVIPVLVDGALTPKADKLPDSVKPLVRRNAVEVRNTQFGRDAEALANKVREALKIARPAMGRWPFLATATAWLKAPGQWRTVAGSAMALLLVGWIGLYEMGLPVWVPWAAQPDSPRAAAEAELQRLKEEVQRQSKAAAAAEAKRKAAEAELQQIKEEVERQTKAAADAEAKLKAAETEQQRLAGLQEEDQRKARAAADVEAKRKAAEAEQQRLAALKAEEQRQVRAAADVEAERKAAEAEQQRLKEEVQRQAKAVVDPPAMVSATGLFTIRTNTQVIGVSDDIPRYVPSISDCERNCAKLASCKVFSYNRSSGVCYRYTQVPSVALNEKFDSGIRIEQSNSPKAALPATQSAPTVATGPFTIRSNTEAIGSPPVDGKPVRSIGECEQSCTQSATCKIFTFRKSTAMCYTYSDATFVPSDYFVTGIRQ
jgi:hypothetical protein